MTATKYTPAAVKSCTNGSTATNSDPPITPTVTSITAKSVSMASSGIRTVRPAPTARLHGGMCGI